MKIKKNITLLWMLLSPVITYAQQYVGIGVRVNYISNYHYTFDNDNLLNTTDDVRDRDVKSISADIVLETIKKTQIFYRMRIGYQSIFEENNNLYNYSNSESRTVNIENEYKEYRFGVGIGKLYEINNDKVILKLGLELLFNYTKPQHKYFRTENFDVSGNLIEKDIRYYDEPERHSGGINIFSSIYYTFWKSFSVGFEIANGFRYTYSKGSFDVIYEHYDASGNLTNTNSENDKVKLNDFSTSFMNISIGVAYKF